MRVLQLGWIWAGLCFCCDAVGEPDRPKLPQFPRVPALVRHVPAEVMGFIVDFMCQVDCYSRMVSDDSICWRVLTFVDAEMPEVLAWGSANHSTLQGCASARSQFLSFFLLYDSQQGYLTPPQFRAAQDIAHNMRAWRDRLREHAPFPLGFNASRTAPSHGPSTTTSSSSSSSSSNVVRPYPHDYYVDMRPLTPTTLLDNYYAAAYGEVPWTGHDNTSTVPAPPESSSRSSASGLQDGDESEGFD